MQLRGCIIIKKGKGVSILKEQIKRMRKRCKSVWFDTLLHETCNDCEHDISLCDTCHFSSVDKRPHQYTDEDIDVIIKDITEKGIEQ